MKTAFITGVTGQDGSYLAELLLSKGYEVHGLKRRSSTFNTQRIDHIYQDFHEEQPRFYLYYGDLTDSSSLWKLLYEIRPDEIYNLGAQSHVRVSFDMPEYTVDTVALGTLRLLEAIRGTGIGARYYQACSSEMFGASPPPQNETTPFYPRSPYGCAKVFAHYATINYREAYGLFAACGILFNHESPRRGETFVSRKIARAAARIRSGLENRLYLGNLEARRDWGYAPEYTEAMWRMLQADEPADYVIGTGETHSVRQFVEEAFAAVDLDWKEFVEIDPRYCRPSEVDVLRADPAKARRALGWHHRVDFRHLVRIMVAAEMAAIHGKDAARVASAGAPFAV